MLLFSFIFVLRSLSKIYYRVIFILNNFAGKQFLKSSLEDIIAIKNEENLDGGKNFLIDLLNFLQKIRVNY